MIDSNWEVVNGDTAHTVEVLNQSNQINVIEALLHVALHKYPADENGSCNFVPGPAVIKEFHRTATLLLLNDPGNYRTEPVVVQNTSTGEVVYEAPPFNEIEYYLNEFCTQLNQMWETASANKVAAFALWLVNWVHPFKNGNGRTARAYCYTCLSLKLGMIMPGKKTVIELIMEQRERYYFALRAADKGYAETGEPDLSVLSEFIGDLAILQLKSAT